MKAFKKAVIHDNYDKVDVLIESESPSFENNWAIKYASEHGYLDIVRLLLTHPGVYPSVDNYPVRMAVKNGYWDVVQVLLLEKGFVTPGLLLNIDDSNDDDLCTAIENGNWDVAQTYLLEKGLAKI